MSREEAFWLPGPSGQIFAVLHRPESTQPVSTCIIMCSSGQLSRVGPQRLYVRAARAWAKLGLTVLRVDLAGVGDSQAENPTIHFDNHAVGEVDAVVRYAHEELGAERIVLQGLCAGARVAVKCAAGNPLISAVLAWSCPVFSSTDGMPKAPDESDTRRLQSLAASSRSQLARVLCERLFLKAAWWRKRLRWARVDLGRVLRAFFWHGARRSCDRQPLSTGFLDSADAYLGVGREVLFVYGSQDRLALTESRERFSELPEGSGLPQCRCILADTGHTFASVSAQDELIDISGNWLTGRKVGALRSVDSFRTWQRSRNCASATPNRV